MALNLIEKLASLSSRASDLSGTPSKWTANAVTASGPFKTRSSDLAPFTAIEANLDADVSWSPGPPSIRIVARESLFKHIRVDLSGTRLCISSQVEFQGARPKIEISSRLALEAHVAASAMLMTEWLEGELLMATARGRGVALLSGRAREAHYETIEDGVIDAASLLCEVAAADASGSSIVLVRALKALSAELRDNGTILTVGTPQVLDSIRR